MDINNNSNQTYLTNPLEIVQQLFEQYIATNGDVHSDWGISKHFEALLGSNWDHVQTKTISKLNFILDPFPKHLSS